MKISTLKLFTVLLMVFAISVSNAQKKVAYITSNRAMDVTASKTDDDAIIRLLKKDANFDVTVFAVADDATVDLNGFDIAVIQESFGSTSGILSPSGSAALSQISIPFLYNKVWAIKDGRAVTSGSPTGGGEIVGTTIEVDPAKQSHELFNAITFTSNKFDVFKETADDTGADGTKALNYARDVTLSNTNTLFGTASEITDAATTIFLNDIPAGTQIGSETLQARMIAFGQNFGAISKNNGTNFTDNGITLWRNALYSLARLPVPTTPVGAAQPTKVAYLTSNRTMDATASTTDDDVIIRLLKEDVNFDVTVFAVADDATVDLTGFELVVVQESFGSTASILSPTGSAALSQISVPFVYNKVYALKDGRAIASGSPTGGGDIAGKDIEVDPANQSNELFNGITFTDNKFTVFKETADDNGAGGTKALNYARGVTMSNTSTLLGEAAEITDAASSIFVNDIPSGTQIGSETTQARMISFGQNFGAISKNGGKNFTTNGLTLWRNALYSLAGITVPATPYVGVLVEPDLGPVKIINIDFGSDQNMTTPNWNNFTANHNNPDSVMQLIDSGGNETGIDAYVYDTFSSVNSSGTTTPDVTLDMPASATSDSYYGHAGEFNGKEVPTGGFKFVNLDPNTAYSFTIFGSRTATDNREAKYTVTGQNMGTASLNAASNTSEVATIENINPDGNGVITLDVSKGENNDNSVGFFYIGAIRIAYDTTTTVMELDALINIDCGDSATLAQPYWNNFSITHNTDGTTVQLVNAEGEMTGISAYVYDPFSAVNTAGTTSPAAAIDMPVNATSDSYYGHTGEFNGKVIPSGGFRFENLKQGSKYTFVIFGSRTASDNRDTKYTVVGGNTGTANLNVASNTSEVAVISDITPDAEGKIVLNVEKGDANDNSTGFFYIGAIRILSDAITSNDELKLDDDEISVYPVPFDNIIMLDKVPLYSTVSVYTITGSKILETRNNEGGKMSLNTSDLKAGIYILKISDNDTKIKAYKIIKR
ncbi:T9SS C-terminal target domain-containing protein [Mariniphaga sediminis]|jgi:3-deoxy-D-arabino-heptulosonate 7-phosphate (DAHP) synthase|uniref:T9SS C-terminal target domain-containing protein n=1 Tax=Mariniphaga sediminis TaxID=1628158 RepID=A0A399D096_9BACT|nr:T9SS type A sorting domain-containing protein [Mariniphaga sediminis]RIH65435.1 T9SS C-terminal target domain-containing protein [Mariniphaga sediminis]